VARLLDDLENWSPSDSYAHLTMRGFDAAVGTGPPEPLPSLGLSEVSEGHGEVEEAIGPGVKVSSEENDAMELDV
jgi:hypothetical protein